MIAPRFPLKVKGDGTVTDSTPLPEPIFVGQSAGGGFATKADRTLQAPPTEKVNKNAGTLGYITQNRIDLEALMRMDQTGYLDPLKILSDGDVFRKNFIGPLPHLKKCSRFMLRHATNLKEWGVMGKARSELYYALPMFTTEKKTLELRLIQNCIPVNRVYAKPPHMDLPLIHDLIDEVLRHSVMGQADAVSYFYQFALVNDVARYFGARFTDARGGYEDLLMNVMPMGFSWSCAIAQRTANVLVRGCGVAWVDNFILLGKNGHDFDEKVTKFMGRRKEANLELDKETIVGTTHGVALGMEFDLVGKLYRMDPEWTVKAADRIEAILRKETGITVLELYTLSGTVVWRHHVMRHKLCNIPHTLAMVGKAARTISGGSGWDSPANVSSECIEEFREAVRLLRENPWMGPRNESAPECEIWSDASDSFWAFLVFVEGKLVSAKQGTTKPDMHIFYSELSVALGGVSAASRLGLKSALSHIDNAAAGGALQRGESSNFTANRWIARKLMDDVRVRWVSTNDMLADPYTRIPPGEKTPLPLPPLGTTVEEARRILVEDQDRRKADKSLRRPWGKATRVREPLGKKINPIPSFLL